MAEIADDEPTRLDERKRSFLRGALPPGLRDAMSDLLAPAAAAPHPEPSLSFRRYELHEKVGEGGMAVVYRATDRDLGREVALKVMRKTLDLTETGRKRFLREALVGARLSHPNLVTLHDAGEENGWTFLVMELVKGEPLSMVLAGRRHETRPMVALLEKAARAVQAAHEQGVVHRDLKPANILVTAAGEPKVADFGLAHLTDADAAMTRTGATMGTPSYMAPEQLGGAAVRISERTDVYALGAILYEVLTGRPPHTGDSTMEIYAKLQQEDPMPPRRVNSGVNRELETICLTALDRDPQRRYRSAAAFADDLRRHLDGESILARPPGPATRAVKWARRHRLTTAIGMMSLAAAAVLSWVLLSSAARARAERQDDVRRLLEEGRRLQVQRRELDETLAGFLRRRDVLNAEIPADGVEEVKQPLWTLDEQIEAAKLQRADLQASMLSAYSKAVGRDPGCDEAKRFLSGYYLAEYERATDAGDSLRAAEAQQYVRLHDPDGTFAPRLRAAAKITFESKPPGADVHLFRYARGSDRRLVARSFPDGAGTSECSAGNRLGACPVQSATLEAGSYMAILRLPGYRDVRYPFLIGRGGDISAHVDLYTESEIGADFIYVPAGPFIRGGDPGASPEIARQTETLGSYFISRHETTCAEYAEFISAISAREGVEEARKRVPRQAPRGSPLWNLPEDGSAYRVHGGSSEWPAVSISWDDVVAYCRWRTERGRMAGDHRVYRLPTGDEWEKAGRGSDGRFYPWGDFFDWSFTRAAFMASSEQTARYFDNIGSHPKDCSPYGVMDMAGSWSEWCATRYPNTTLVLYQTRGGSVLMSSPDAYRVANIRGASPSTVVPAVAFRMVVDAPRR